jgi:hypothetical protein
MSGHDVTPGVLGQKRVTASRVFWVADRRRVTSRIDICDRAAARQSAGEFLTAIEGYWDVSASVDHHCRVTNGADAVGDGVGFRQRRDRLGYALTALVDQVRQPRLLVLRAIEKQQQTGGGLGVTAGETVANLAHLGEVARTESVGHGVDEDEAFDASGVEQCRAQRREAALGVSHPGRRGQIEMIKHGHPVTGRDPVREALSVIDRRAMESQIPSDATKL